MAPTLYITIASPPCRAVQMAADALNVTLDLKEIDLTKHEHKNPDFVKLNPQHTLPTLVEDDGFVVWDSHAIMAYLVTMYSQDDSLYPKDPKKRALVDQRLHFDSGVAWVKVMQVMKPVVFEGVKTISQSGVDIINEMYGLVEAFLNGKKWIAGDELTIADFSFITTLTSVGAFVKIDGTKFPELVAYLKRAESLPENEVNKRGLDVFCALFEKLLVN